MVFLRPAFKALIFVVVSGVAAVPAPELAARNNVISVVLPTGTVNGTTWPTSIPAGKGTAIPSVTVIDGNGTLFTTTYPTLTAVPGNGTIFPTVHRQQRHLAYQYSRCEYLNGTTTVIGGANGTFTGCVSYPAIPTGSGTVFTSTCITSSSNKTAIPTSTFVGGSTVVCATFATVPTTVSLNNGTALPTVTSY